MEVNVYDMNGMVVRSTREPVIDDLQAGIYVIRVGSLTRKVRI